MSGCRNVQILVSGLCGYREFAELITGKRENKMCIANTPYDDVFRTLLTDCTKLIIPIVNEIFKEDYRFVFCYCGGHDFQELSFGVPKQHRWQHGDPDLRV